MPKFDNVLIWAANLVLLRWVGLVCCLECFLCLNWLSWNGWNVQKNFNQTIKLLTCTEEELKKCRYGLKERDFIISEQRKAGMIDFSSTEFLLIFFNVLIILMNFQNRECSGSSSLCFTIWPWESTSGQCFFVSEDWYVVLDLVLNSQLYCYAIESCNYLQDAVQVEKINWVLITDQWLTILEGSSPNRLFLYVTWYLCLYLSKMNIFSVFRNLVIPS